jgi:hypothetical protein
MEPQICGDLEEMRLRIITAVRFPGRAGRGLGGAVTGGNGGPAAIRLNGAAIHSRATFDQTKLGHEKQHTIFKQAILIRRSSPSRKLSIDPSLSLRTSVYATALEYLGRAIPPGSGRTGTSKG